MAASNSAVHASHVQFCCPAGAPRTVLLLANQSLLSPELDAAQMPCCSSLAQWQELVMSGNDTMLGVFAGMRALESLITNLESDEKCR